MKRCLILLSLVSLFAGVAGAAVKQGDTELEFLGAYLSENGADDGADVSAFVLAGAIGYFVTDNIQVAGAATGVWADIDDESTNVYAVGGRAAWHFMPTNQWVPYVGGQVLWATADSDFAENDVDGLLWGPLGGLRYELNEYNDFFAEIQWQLWSGDISDVFDDGWGIFLGIIHQFK